MDANEWRQVGEIVVETTEKLFGMMGLDLAYAGSPERIPQAEELTVAVIGFAGSQMRGSLVVGATRGILHFSHPLGTGADDDGLRDWAGELANQLIGRMKIRLLAHEIVIQLGTPTTMSGHELTLGAALKNPHCLPHRFAMREPGAMREPSENWLLVRLEGVAEPGVRLLGSPGAVPDTDEGELLLF